jgi:hypothetical protein
MDEPRALTKADAKLIADAIVETLAQKETAERVIGTWSTYLDAAIGRGIRRIAFWIVIGLLSIAAVKFDLWQVIAKSFK